MAPLPLLTTPSRGTRSPGLTRMVAPMETSEEGVVTQAPSAVSIKASSGASWSKPAMALRARSTALASISSAIAYRAITMAASGHWPIANAPVTATDISALMLSLPLKIAFMPLA